MTAANRRFDRILQPNGPAPAYDSVLLDLGKTVVAPTLGSIIPNWVLAIPKSASQNFVAWAGDHRAAPLDCIAEITRRLRGDALTTIWFEHGSTHSASVTGCGVDHAHIHILLQPPFKFSAFKQAATESASLDWKEGFGNPYCRIEGDESYLVAGCGDEYLFAQSVESAGPQYFRRVVAVIVNTPNTWDYRIYPHLDNIAITVSSCGRRAA